MKREDYDRMVKRIAESFENNDITLDNYIQSITFLNDRYEKEKEVELADCPYHGIGLIPGNGTHYCPHLSCNYFIHDRVLLQSKQSQYKTVEKMLDEHYRAGHIPGEVYSDMIILLRTKYILPKGR